MEKKMEMIQFFRIPVEIVYKIMRYVPCYGLTSEKIRNHRYFLRTMYILRSIRNLTDDDRKEIKELLVHQNFDFLKEKHFELLNENFFLAVFYKSRRKEPDYILISL